MRPAAGPNTRSSTSSTVSGPAVHTWLYAPGLAELLREDWRDRAPVLARLLERGRTLAPPTALVALARPDAPAAAYSRLADCGDAGGAWWLRADPALMQADISRVHLLAVGDLGLSVAQEQSLVEDLAPLFGDEGLQLSRGGPGRWYVRCEGPIEARFTPPDRALGRPLEDHLPGGTGFWQRLLSECQMQLHDHPVNRERIAAGYPSVTSLWFWGAGTLPTPQPMPFAHACVHSASLRGWCLRHGVALVESPAQAFPSAQGAGLVEWCPDRSVDRRHNLARLETLLVEASSTAATVAVTDGSAAAALVGADGWRVWRKGVTRFADNA